MNLIDPAGMTDDDFEKFSTSLGKVLKFMKLSNNRKEMKKLMETDEAYRSIDRNAARVLQECANISLDISSNQEVVDVCQAWRDERDLAAKESAISSAIEAWRDVDIPDNEIKKKIITKYNLSEEEAESYMAQKTA